MKQLTADSIASLFCRLPRHWILVALLCQHESFLREHLQMAQKPPFWNLFSIFMRASVDPRCNHPEHFCWRVCPGWLIGYRICDITFFVPNQLHLILQLLCSLTPTCYTNWSLKLSLPVQVGYHMGHNESENVNFLVAGHMKRKWLHRFLTKCAENVQSWFGHHQLWLVKWEQSVKSKLSDAKTPISCGLQKP